MNLYISDLDGTLLNSKQVISDKSISIINNLIIDHNLNFTIATARSISTAWDLISNIHLNFPIIFHNGVYVYDPINKINILENILSANESLIYIKLLEEYNLNPIVYTESPSRGNKIYYKGIFNQGEEDYINDRLSKNDKRFNLTNNYSEIENQNVVSINVINTKEHIDPFYLLVKEKFNYCYHYGEDIYSKYYWLETNHINANKKDALIYIREKFKFNKITTFGDNLNDRQMFEISDECYAVFNAVESIKKIATKVISSNDEDGVAIYLESICGNFR